MMLLPGARLPLSRPIALVLVHVQKRNRLHLPHSHRLLVEKPSLDRQT